MAYNTLIHIRSSTGLRNRLVAAAAQEGVELPERWVENSLWAIISNSEWIAAWEYAANTMTVNHNPDIGARDDVIGDQMILAAIQARITELANPSTS